MDTGRRDPTALVGWPLGSTRTTAFTRSSSDRRSKVGRASSLVLTDVAAVESAPVANRSMTSDEGPTARSDPCWIHAVRSHSQPTMSRSWLTTMMVRPSAFSWANRSRHRFWNVRSPTASTSSTSNTSGSTWMATEKPSRTYMPDE